MERNPNATDRMWKVYNRMQTDGVEPELPLYRNLLGALTKNGDSARDLDRAKEVVVAMERCESISTHQLSHRPDYTERIRIKIQRARVSISNDTRSESNCGDNVLDSSSEQQV